MCRFHWLVKVLASILRERIPAATGRGARGRPFYAGAIKSGDNIYAVSRFKGTFVIKADTTFELVSHNVIVGDESAFHGTPAISNGQIFLRSNSHLYCIGDK